MPFLNVKRATVPTDVTLPVAAQTLGTKSANFFAGWTSPVTSVFNSGALGGAKALTEQNFDGRIAAKTISSWRDAEVTTYAGSVYTLLRLTPAGRAFNFFYSINSGGTLVIEEVSGIDPALPIRQGGNGVSVRAIYDSAAGGQTMTTRFGPSGTDVVANYSSTPTAGDTVTFGAVGTRLYVKWKTTIIVDLPYDGWTLMEAGQIALAPFAGYGVIDSSVDFRPLVVLDSVASSIPHPSDFSNSAAPTINLHDVGLKQIRQTGCSISVGSTTLTVPSTTPWRVGDKGIVEAGQVAFTITPGGGNAGNGHFVLGCPYLSHDNLANWQTGNWVVTFTSASTLDAAGHVVTPGVYTVTRPNASSGGTGTAETRYNNGITFQIMEGGTATLVDGRVTWVGRVPFAAGDTFTIACATSGESTTSTFDGKPAAGRNRTMGVGGCKPVQSLTQAQFDAPTNLGYPADSLAYISDNPSGNQGKVVYVGPGGASYSDLTSVFNYYFNKQRPMALPFKVVAILSPTTLQINTAASATTANATVWFNAQPVFDRVLSQPFQIYNNVTVRIPAGDYAASADETVSSTIFNYGGPRTGWKLRGEGIDVTNIWQPRGVDGNFMNFNRWIDSGDDCVCDFSVYGNDHINGGFARQIVVGQPNVNHLISNIANLITFGSCNQSSISRVKVVNSRGQALDVSSASNSFIKNCISLKTVPAVNYSGWLINMSDSTDRANPCGHLNNTMIHSWLQGASETFASNGGTIDGFTAVNAVLSTNSSNDWTYSNGTLTFTKNCLFDGVGFAINATPALSVASNQLQTATTGGRILNVDFIYQGYCTENNEMNNAIVIERSPSPGVIVDGNYNPLVADDGNRRGLISRPPWIAGDENLSVMLLVTGGDVSSVATLTNYRFVGDAVVRPQVYNAGTLTASNNIVDTIGGSPAPTLSGNVTNVVYNAL